MKHKYLRYGLAACILTGCSIESDIITDTPQEEVMITASINNHEDASRVVFEESGSMTYANWEVGDGITLFSAEQNNLHYIAKEGNTDEGIQFVTTTNEVLKDLEGQKVYACYPYSDNGVSEISLSATNLLDYNESPDNNIYCPFLYGRGGYPSRKVGSEFQSSLCLFEIGNRSEGITI